MSTHDQTVEAQAESTYRKFNKYYARRTGILGLQTAAHTPEFRFILRELEEATNILDVGCGRGMYLVPLTQRGKNVVGLDYCPENVELLHRHDYQAFACDCVREIPAQFRDFDAVVCSEVIEHLTREEAQELLANIRAALKAGGKLVVTVPYRENFMGNIATCPDCGREFHRHGHVQCFASTAELRFQVEAAGLTFLHDHVFYRQLARFRVTPFWGYLLASKLRPKKPGDLIAVFRK